MNDYKPGDRVTLQHLDGSKLVDRVVDSVYSVLIGKRREYVNDLTGSGWRIVGHKPRVEIPTEQGTYKVTDPDSPGGFDVIHRTSGGDWVDHNDGYYLDGVKLATYSNFTRLVPVGSEREQAIRDVLKYIDDFAWEPGQVRIFEYGQAARILEHFGYAP